MAYKAEIVSKELYANKFVEWNFFFYSTATCCKAAPQILFDIAYPLFA